MLYDLFLSINRYLLLFRRVILHAVKIWRSLFFRWLKLIRTYCNEHHSQKDEWTGLRFQCLAIQYWLQNKLNISNFKCLILNFHSIFDFEYFLFNFTHSLPATSSLNYTLKVHFSFPVIRPTHERDSWKQNTDLLVSVFFLFKGKSGTKLSDSMASQGQNGTKQNELSRWAFVPDQKQKSLVWLYSIITMKANW